MATGISFPQRAGRHGNYSFGFPLTQLDRHNFLPGETQIPPATISRLPKMTALIPPSSGIPEQARFSVPWRRKKTVLSLWQYLRQRTRDAVLAGVQDALQAIEEGDPSDLYRKPVDQLERSLSEISQQKIVANPASVPAKTPPAASLAPDPSPAVGALPVTASYDDRLAAPVQPKTPQLPGLGRQSTVPPRRGRPRHDQP